MKRIGITGGIGAGKSVVSRILRSKGYKVYDCDSEARALMDASNSLKQDICRRFGSECIDQDGNLDRRRIASFVFSSAEHRAWLNSLVHAMVREDIDSYGDEVLFIESAILKTSGLTEMVECVWIVTASTETRLKRAVSRDGDSEENILARMRSQVSEFDDFGYMRVEQINNDNDTPLLPQIEKCLTKIFIDA